MELRPLYALILALFAVAGGCFYYYHASMPKIALIRVEGAIENFYKYTDLAHKALEDDSIKAVVLFIDSPGGTVQACFQTERAFRELNQHKPVVVSLGQYATSGAYLLASASSYIYAYDYTATGGLGVIAIWVSYENYYKERGIKWYVWKSGEMKDIGAEYRGPTPEENEYLQELVDAYMDELMNRILMNRPGILDLENLRKGEVYFGIDALDKGLIDEIGSLKDAEEKAAALADLKKGEYRVVSLS